MGTAGRLSGRSRLDTRAEIRLPTSELRDDLPFYTKTLKMAVST